MEPQEQREAFRDQVKVAMALRSWNSVRTAKEAGIRSENTMTRVMKAESVSAGTILKLRKALDIPALADAQADAGYPPEIEWVRDAVGMWLRDTPEEEREVKVNAIMEVIIKGKFGKDVNTPS